MNNEQFSFSLSSISIGFVMRIKGKVNDVALKHQMIEKKPYCLFLTIFTKFALAKATHIVFTNHKSTPKK